MVNLGSAYGEIQIGTGGAEQNVASLADKLRSTGQAMSLALTAPLVGLAVTGAMAAADFEQSLNTMQVVSGATAEQMQALSDTALQLGADTSFSAGEAAQGMLELAKAGMSTDEVLASITGTLDLAAASGMGVAQAAEVSANALNTFGLDASEAGRVADLLAAAANASSVEVTDMAQGMTMAGAVFAANKVPIEDLSTAIALLGNNGIKGSDAGTSLKTMLMRLTAPSTEAAGAMMNLGLEVYNADGSMRAFEDVVGQLETATAGLSDQQRNQALTTIFGADAIRAANILITEGSASYAEMKDKVTQVGAAQEVADSKLKGLAGAIEYAKGTIESTLIAAILPFMDGMSGLIRQGADLIGMFTSLPGPVQNAALAFAAVLAAAGPVMLAVAGIGAALGFLLSPIGLIVVGVAALAAAWTADFMGLRTITEQALAPIMGYFNDIITLFTSGTLPIGDVFGELGSILFGFNTETYDTSEGIWTLVSALTGSETAATQFTDALWAIGDVTTQAVTGLQYYSEAVTDAGFGSIEAQEAITALPAALQPLALAFDSLAATVSSWVTSLMSSNLFVAETSAMYAAFRNQVAAALQGIQTAWNALMSLLEPALARLQAAFAQAQTDVGALGPKFQELWVAVQAMWVALQPVLEAFGALIGATIAVVAVTAVNVLAQAFTILGTVAGTVLDQITLTVTTFAAVITEVVALIKAVIDGDWNEVWQRARNIFQIFSEFFSATFANMKLLVVTIFTAIKTAVLDTLKDLNIDGAAILETIKAWWDAIWGGFRSVIDPIVGAVNAILDAMTNLSNMNFKPPWEGLSPPDWWNPGGWFGGGGEANPPGQNAMGTNYWRGGLSWVGERGPELVDIPRGARIYNAQDSQQVGKGVTFNMTNNLSSQLDMVELAHRVAGMIVQYGGA